MFEFGGNWYYRPPEKPQKAYAILNEFVDACEELGARYWLFMGTALGFYRDGGWNKWDVDIDVLILGEDWEAVKGAMLARGYTMLPSTPHFLNEDRVLLNVSTIKRVERRFDGHALLEHNGRQYRISDDIEGDLEETYGSTWRTPTPPNDLEAIGMA